MSSARPNRRRPRPQPRKYARDAEGRAVSRDYQADRDSGLINDYRQDPQGSPGGGDISDYPKG